MSKEILALLGGAPIVRTPHPHYVWGLAKDKYKNELIKYIEDGRPLSIDGRSGIYEELENRFAQYHGVKYALLTNSGTTALHSAFFGIGILPGDEVIAPAYTFLATVTPILHCTGVPILCDSRVDNGNIDATLIESLITKRTKAIVINHQWGHPVDMSLVTDISKRHNLLLVEDCSHAIGATYEGRKVGTFGDVACISLQANKLIYAGEGGVLLTNNKEIYERAILLGHFQKRTKSVTLEKYKYLSETGYGLKYRQHPLGAVLANALLKDVDQLIENRNRNLDYFSKKLSRVKGIEPPFTASNVTRGAYYGYKPKIKFDELHPIDRETYMKALVAEGVEVKIPKSKPLNFYPLFQNKFIELSGSDKPLYKAGDFPAAEKYYDEIMSLPTFTEPSTQIIDEYIGAFEKVYRLKDQLLEYRVTNKEP